MTSPEMHLEHQHTYESRLGCLGYGPGEVPSAIHHNAAVLEADAHIADLKRQERGKVAEKFDQMRLAIS